MQPSTSFRFFKNATVIVQNALEGRQDLVFHCMSADNDLGVKNLRFRELTSLKERCSIVPLHGQVPRTSLKFTTQKGITALVIYAVG